MVADLITIKWEVARVYGMDLVDRQMTYVLGEMEWNSVWFHHTTQNDSQFKTHELFISSIFHAIFFSHSWLQVTEAMESETVETTLGLA
jgi:hypothetical protein